MTAVAQSLKSQLERLTLEERAELASYLIASLDLESDSDAKVAWNAELDRRTQEILRGEVKGELASEVFVRLRDRCR